MVLTDTIREIENSYQPNVITIKKVVGPLVPVMPELIEDFYTSLNWGSNKTGTLMSLKKIEDEYRESSLLYKLKVEIRKCHIWIGENLAKFPYRNH